MPWNNTRTNYKHLHTKLWWPLTHAAAVRWECRTVRDLCHLRCVKAFEGQVKPQTVLNKLYWHVTVAKYRPAAKEWWGSAFFVSRCQQFTLTNWEWDWTECPVMAKMDVKNARTANCPEEDVRMNNCVQGECPTPVSNCYDLLATGLPCANRQTDRLAQTLVCKAAVRPMRGFVGCFGPLNTVN